MVSVISKWVASGDMEVLDTTNFFIHPEFIIPKEETVQGKRAWEWTGKETMSPMWAVARYTEHNLEMINARDKTTLKQTVRATWTKINIDHWGGLGPPGNGTHISLRGPHGTTHPIH